MEGVPFGRYRLIQLGAGGMGEVWRVIRIATLGRRAVSSGQLQSGAQSWGESFSHVGAERHDTSSSR